MINSLPPIHPGEFVHEIMDDLELTQVQLAKALDISPMHISYLLKGKHPITAEFALHLSHAFGQSPQYWLNLQISYDLKLAQIEWKDGLNNLR